MIISYIDNNLINHTIIAVLGVIKVKMIASKLGRLILVADVLLGHLIINCDYKLQALNNQITTTDINQMLYYKHQQYYYILKVERSIHIQQYHQLLH